MTRRTLTQIASPPPPRNQRRRRPHPPLSRRSRRTQTTIKIRRPLQRLHRRAQRI